MSIFDIDGAFELGFSETGIAKGLSRIVGFDYDAAMQRGRRYSDGGKLTDRDIIEYLRGSTRQGYDVGAVLDATAGFIKSTPPSILGAIGTLARDEDPYAEQNRFTEWERAAEQKSDEFRQRIEGKEHYPVIPGIATVEDVGTVADSVGHSLVGMGPSILGSVGSGLSNIAPTPQTKVAGKTLSTLGGMLGSAVTIGKIDAKAVGKQLIDAADMEMLAEEGRLLGPEERKALLDNTRELRNEHALWEAGPEAAGNAIEMVGLGKILTGALKGKGLVSAVKKVVGGGAMNLGTEYATETTTGVFQQPVEVELGLSEDKEKWSPTDPKAWKESFKEQLGPTTLLVGALGASAGGIGATGRLARAGADKISGRAPQKQSALIDQVPDEYKQLFVGAAQRHGVPLDFLISIAKNESSFNPRAESGTGPQGIMQISKGKQKDWGVKDPFDPVESVDVAAREIAKYMRAYDGDMDTVAAVYNQGEGYAKTWRDNADARSYVSKINRTMGDQAVLAGQRRDLAALEDYASALPARTEEMHGQVRDAGGDYRQQLLDAAGLTEPSEAEWQRALARKDDIVAPLGDLGTEAAVAAEQDSTPEGYTLGRDVAGTRYADVGVDPASTERMINEASFERNSGLGMPVTGANSTLAQQDAFTEAQRIAEAQDDARRLYDERDRATFTPAPGYAQTGTPVLPITGLGRPVTAEESVLARQTPEEYTPAQQRQARREDIEQAFKHTVLPDKIEQRLAVVERQMDQGEVGSRWRLPDVYGDGGHVVESGRWDGMKSTNPDWLKDKDSILHKAGKSGIRAVIKKARAGQQLTARQEEIWDELIRVAEREYQNDPETGIAQTYQDIYEKEGLTGGGPKSQVYAGDLSPGDKVLVSDYRGPHVAEHRGYDAQGRAIIKNGVEIHADPWDAIGVEDFKRGSDRKAFPGRSNRMLEVGDADQVVAARQAAKSERKEQSSSWFHRAPAAPVADAQGFVTDQQGRDQWAGTAKPESALKQEIRRLKERSAARKGKLPDGARRQSEHRARGGVQGARRGRDEKYGVDVEMTGGVKSGFVITETGPNGAQSAKKISSGMGGIYVDGYTLNMDGDFVPSGEIVQAGGRSVDSSRRAFKPSSAQREDVTSLVAEIEFNRSIGNMDAVRRLEKDLLDIVFGKSIPAPNELSQGAGQQAAETKPKTLRERIEQRRGEQVPQAVRDLVAPTQAEPQIAQPSARNVAQEQPDAKKADAKEGTAQAKKQGEKEVSQGEEKHSKAKPEGHRANVLAEIGKAIGQLRAQRLIRNGRVVVLKSQEEAKQVIDAGPNPKFSKEFEKKSLLDLGVKDSESLHVGDTPIVLTTLGAQQLPLVVSGRVLNKATVGKHGGTLGVEELRQVHAEIYDPVAVFESATQPNSMVILTQVKDAKGDLVIVPVHLSTTRDHHQVNAIKSIYGKENSEKWIKRQVKNGNLLYMNTEKAKAFDKAVWLHLPTPTLASEAPAVKKALGYARKILTEADIVNAEIKHSKDGKIQGFYLDGKAYLVEDGIAEGQAMAVLMHELGEHAAQLGFTNNLEYRAILKSLEKRQNEQSEIGEAIRAALQRVPEETTGKHKWSEVAAYLVENNADQGLSLVNRLVAFFKKWLYKAGAISADKLTHKDLAAFAYSAVRAEARRSGKLAEGGRVADVALSRQQQAEASESRAAKTNGLPMDFDSRMARAREMGFDTDTVFSHASWTDPVIERILAKDTTFDGLFAVEREESSHGGPHQHRFIVKTHFDHADLSRSFRNDDAPFKEVVKREFGEEPGTNEDWSLLEDLVLENESVHELWSDEDSVPTFFKEALGGYISGDLLADISWNIQKLRGKVAKEYGADAIDMTDEHGTSVLLLPGSGVRSLKAAFDPSYVESDQLLRSMAENLGVTAEQLQREYDAVVKRYKGTEQWLKAPNGKKSNLNERQWVQVRTESFKKWFGDWENDSDNASKVVDDNEEPLVVYHGSPSPEFSEFNLDKSGSNLDSGWLGKGIYFTDTAATADYHSQTGRASRPGVYPVFLNIKNPFEWGKKTKGIRGLVMNGEQLPLDLTEKISEKTGFKFDQDAEPDWGAEKKLSRALTDELSSRGFDGVVASVRGQQEFVAFSPTQIKSATGNTGAFDASNQDIRYSIASAATNTFTGAKGRLEQILENSPEWRDRWERFIYNFIDSNDPRTRVWKRAGSPTDSEMVTLERLRGKKAAADQKEFYDEMVTPLLKKMKEGGLKEGDLEEYAHAMHTPERNERMRRVNAKRTLDSLLGEMTEAERREYDEQVELLRKGGKRDGWDTEDIQDSYLQMIDEIFDELAFREAEHRRAEQEYEDRVWTDEELEKATPERLRKRLDSVADRLEKSRKIKERWQKESIRFAGMTDAEAASVVKKWKADKRFDVVESARKDMAEISAKTLAVLRESGDISQEEFEAMSIGYKYYVPLHRDGFQDTRPATGRMTGPTGKPFKVAKGSMSEVVSILGNVIRAHDTAISRKHKLSAGRALYEFALAYPEAGITVEKQEQQPTHDREGNVSMYTSQTEPVDGVFVKVDGKRHLLRFAVDERTPEGRTLGRMLDSIKGADTQMGSLMSMLHTVTRFLAMVNTSLSPEFIITNFSRDFQTAFVHLSQEDIDKPGLKKAIAKDIVPAIKGIWAAENGKKDSDMAKWYADFAKNGGKVGWMQGYESIRELEGKLKSEMDLYGEGMRAKKVRKKVLRTIDAANTAIENGVRLATYKNLVDNGVSKQQAALISSSLTVDFTQRGKMGSQINALYMFANASVQGSVRVAHALAKSPRVRKIAGGIVMTGFSMQMLALTSGGDDDSGNPYVLGVPDHIRERSMLLMVPGTEGKFMRVPMAYGYNVFYNFGAEIANSLYMSIMGKKYNHGQGAMRVVSAALDSFNPINSATLLQTIAPTLVDPFVYVAENKAWHGGDLRPKQNPFGPKTPESQRAWKSTSPVFKGMAEGLNWVTGGDKYEGGLVDISPEVFELAWETATGSMGRFVTNTLSLPLSAAKGDLEANKVPFLRTVYGSWDERSISNRYYETMERAQTAKLRVDGAKTLKERRDAVRSQDYQLYKVAESTEKRIKRLRKVLRREEASGDKKEAERLKKRIVDLQASVLARAN